MFGFGIEAGRALVAAQPERAGFFARQNFESFDRTAFGSSPRLAGRFAQDCGRNLGRVGGKLGGKFLGLRLSRERNEYSRRERGKDSENRMTGRMIYSQGHGKIAARCPEGSRGFQSTVIDTKRSPRRGA